MRLRLLSVIVLITVLQSCNNTDCCLPIDLDNLAGQYIVYEYGYSPGDKYIIESVPEDPAQLLTFDALGCFTSNYQGLSNFKFYRVYEHPTEGRILALYETTPPPDDQVDLAALSHSYIMNQEGDNLELYYRYCIEGCHIGIRRIN
jgi:hypothetical protein